VQFFQTGVILNLSGKSGFQTRLFQNFSFWNKLKQLTGLPDKSG
jgi:hypothetical protein